MRANRWFILAVLFVGRFALGFQFQSAGSVAPFLIDDYGIDYSQIGTLVGLYMLPGLVLAVPGGFIGKRFGDKRVVLVGMALMVMGGALMGAAEDYALIVAGRLISGAGAAFLFVLMTKMLADWFAEKELFFGMSIFIIGWPVGIAAGQAVQGAVAELSSWNVVFHMAAVLVAFGLTATALGYRPPPARTGPDTFSLSGLGQVELWLVCVVGVIWMLINGAYLVVLSFGPTVLIEQGASIVEAGVVASLMSWVFLFALPLGGWLANRFDAPNIIMVAGLIGSAIAAAAIPFIPAPYATFAVFGVALAVAGPVIGALPVEVLRPENRGPGLGIYFLFYFAGSAFIPVAGGALKDMTGTATASMMFAAAMMFAALCLLALFRFEQARLAPATAEAATPR